MAAVKLDVLAFGAHPDDVELSCGGTVIKLKRQGYRVGVVSLTRAERGTRGDWQTRLKEFEESARVMGLDVWEALDIPDTQIELTEGNRLKVVQVLRQYQPELVIAPYWKDRHPDHAYASRLIREAAFYAGLLRVDTGLPPHRPRTIVYYPLYLDFVASFVVDVTDTFDTKLEAIRCYRSQFEDTALASSPATILSSPDFLDFLVTRAKYWGAKIGVRYGEPFRWHGPVPVADLMRTFGHLTELR
ncbi:MAG: bacillithiol biosynthesis deacetylase BshB1 [candidate division KSB1 bacterium]|nr:bacillithiol biosynthesis deacetylase BshB1 [candidate division KSB1 bacterium]